MRNLLGDISAEYILGDRQKAPDGNKTGQVEVAGRMSGSSGSKRVSKRVNKRVNKRVVDRWINGMHKWHGTDLLKKTKMVTTTQVEWRAARVK